ncbi:MAG: hypothetical protein K940chlam6_00813 [Chlamydiae bacterium]|nr:hypothetical protein [Chlamydiota bacterium]
MRYKRLILIPIIFFAGWVSFHKPRGVEYFISFDEAQIVNSYSPRDLINFYQKLCKKKWRTVNRLYTRNLGGRKKRHKKERIPKIIHQIWLDGPIPESIQKLQETWKKQHPDWEYHLWTGKEIEFLYLQNRTLYDAVSTSKAKNKILRYEILYQFGGLFVDIDFACIKSFDILNENCDFYAGLTDQIRSPELSSSLIAATPRHPILRECIQKLRKKAPETFLGEMDDLTNSFFQAVKKFPSQKNVALPATYFYSFSKTDEEVSHHGHTFAIHIPVQELEF